MPRQREKTDYIQIKFRMKEELRAKLEQAAANVGCSMNEEGVHRLRQSFIDEEKLYKDQNMMALVQLLVGTVRMLEMRTGEPWQEDERTRKAVAATVVAFLSGEYGVPFHKPPMLDENGDWLNDDVWLREAPDTAIYDAMRALLQMRGVTEQTVDMIERLVRTDKSERVKKKSTVKAGKK